MAAGFSSSTAGAKWERGERKSLARNTLGSCFSWPEALDLPAVWKEMCSLCCLFLFKGNVLLGAALLGNALDPEPKMGWKRLLCSSVLRILSK